MKDIEPVELPAAFAETLTNRLGGNYDRHMAQFERQLKSDILAPKLHEFIESRLSAAMTFSWDSVPKDHSLWRAAVRYIDAETDDDDERVAKNLLECFYHSSSTAGIRSYWNGMSDGWKSLWRDAVRFVRENLDAPKENPQP